MNSPAPGYYNALGDPPETVRYWDGWQWTGEPMPPPPGFSAGVNSRFGGTGIRIGAALVDTVVSIILVVPFMIGWFRDLFDQIEAGVDADQIDATVPASFYALGLGLTAVWILMVAFLGGTPGKLMLGLRITKEDGTTTPPGLRKALLRAVPGLAAWVPLIGNIIVIGFTILNVVWVSNDPHRRSAYDRIAGTRVIHHR